MLFTPFRTRGQGSSSALKPKSLDHCLLKGENVGGWGQRRPTLGFILPERSFPPCPYHPRLLENSTTADPGAFEKLAVRDELKRHREHMQILLLLPTPPQPPPPPPKGFVYTSRYYLLFLNSVTAARATEQASCRQPRCQAQIKSQILVTEYLSCLFPRLFRCRR